MTVFTFALLVYIAYMEMVTLETLYGLARTVYFRKIVHSDLYGIVLRFCIWCE